MLRIDYSPEEMLASLTWEVTDDGLPWVVSLRGLLLKESDEAKLGSLGLTTPWWSFMAQREEVRKLIQGYGLAYGNDYIATEEATKLLRNSAKKVASYIESAKADPIGHAELQSKLSSLGFARILTAQQARNVGKMARLPSAATFSVPGAGKTTEALAFFFFKAKETDQLLVLAPKNAFAAWDEQLADCMPDTKDKFVRLRGGRESIARMLLDKPRFMIIGYQQFARVGDLIAGHVARFDTFVFLDESHRIKSGSDKVTARSVLKLSHLPVGKLVMSGTPMPQSAADLIPQFSFLYPEVAVTEDTAVEMIRPVYVRTNKSELGLPPVTRYRVPLEMAPMQAELYRLMKSEVAREAAETLTIRSKQAFRSLGRSVARILQFVSNPNLLASEIRFAHEDLLKAVLSEGDGPKLKYVLKRARQLTDEGKKVLIWSSFVKNVEYIASEIDDLGAVYIHGGVDAGDQNDDETREGKIKLFHYDPNTMVMVANPAAASEGVSLHRICHHAIYLDRTFNAAQYLQSEDRIHRLGLPMDQDTTIEIVECRGSVDETVRSRLDFKVSMMAKALEDTNLSIEPIPIEPDDIEGYDEFSTGLSEDDIKALLRL